jgi:cytochrome P450
MLTILGERPDIMAKVLEEQKRLRPNGEEITFEVLEKMEYTKQVAKELLRYRPPVLMVPHQAARDVPLTEEYTVPKGSVVIPSVWPSHHDGAIFKDPHIFDPDRFSPERAEDVKNPKHFLAFGYGPHICLGKEYALNQMICLVAYLVTRCNWTRVRTPLSDEIVIMSTTFPADRSVLTMVPRT